MHIYELATQWITLTMLFFIVDYNTEWLEVVTLGGLVLGSAIMGAWMVLQDRIGVRLGKNMALAMGTRPGENALPDLVHRIVVMLGSLVGVYMLSEALPGYTLVMNGPLVGFLVIYSLIAIALGEILFKHKEAK
ncbi:MAG: hypothetical protein MJ050_06910 [Phascolarctobacterium sp.]|nr:hypothetical protein [Phascolarctobacterium sp.]